MHQLADVLPVLAQYGVSAIGEPALVGTGTLNWNYRVETNAGPRFLRRHRAGVSKERIGEEHALLAWVVERGVPVACAQPTLAGETVVEDGDALWALFPWIAGTSPLRGSLSAAQAGAAGEMHGRIHRLLADYPDPGQLPPRPEFDVPASVTLLERIISAATSQQAEDWILDGLQLQLSLLREHGRAVPNFDGLAFGLCHGDYHDQQLLFEDERVVAVTDWELFGVRPRMWEVIRSLWFSKLMEQPAMTDYVAGYREQLPLAEAECRLGMELWWQGRLHTAWALQAHFLEGNTRVTEFFPELFRVLRVMADEAAREALTERFVRAAAG